MTRHSVIQMRERIDPPNKDIYLVMMACGNLIQSPTHDSFIQAILHFCEIYPDVKLGYYTVHRVYNVCYTHDWIFDNFRDRCKYLLMGMDWDETVPIDLITKQYTYMEGHPETSLAGVKLNMRDGYPQSYNATPHKIPIWLPADSEGVIQAPYIAFDCGMFRCADFAKIDPPYFLERFDVQPSGHLFRADGLVTLNRKMDEAGLKRVILDIKCGHTTTVANKALENAEYLATVAQGKYIE